MQWVKRATDQPSPWLGQQDPSHGAGKGLLPNCQRNIGFEGIPESPLSVILGMGVRRDNSTRTLLLSASRGEFFGRSQLAQLRAREPSSSVPSQARR